MVRAAFKGSVKLLVADRERESVAVIENTAAVGLGGMPESKPAEESESQLGNDAAVHVYDPEPPDAANCAV